MNVPPAENAALAKVIFHGGMITSPNGADSEAGWITPRHFACPLARPLKLSGPGLALAPLGHTSGVPAAALFHGLDKSAIPF